MAFSDIIMLVVATPSTGQVCLLLCLFSLSLSLSLSIRVNWVGLMSVFIHPQVLSLELACQDDRHYDTSTLSSLLSMFNKAKLKDKHFVICCTVMPGYVRHTGRYLIRDCENCTLSYNPEFIAQGDVINGLLKPV